MLISPRRIVMSVGFLLGCALAVAAPKRPVIQGEPWAVTGNPDLGALTNPNQQPVDFAVWQAADGTWQLWSCIRNTKAPGRTRLFYGWEGPALTATNWSPKGIAMQADPALGETENGLQAPHVTKHANLYYLFYGDWEHICCATSADGKRFARRLGQAGRSGMFTEGLGNNTRDAMVIQIGKNWHCYYTAYPNRLGSVYCRTSMDLVNWSASIQVAFGGRAGTNAYSAECPFVVELEPGEFYLFRTQRYGRNAVTSVYHSRDPMNFGINQDESHFLTTLPVAAPEIVRHEGRYYIFYLNPDLNGIRAARLDWVPQAAKK